MAIRTIELPSADYLREILTYDPESGMIIWNERDQSNFATYNAYRTWNSRFAGQPAGWTMVSGGKTYLMLTIDYRKFLASRVIWKMQTGNDPKKEIDHEDGNSLNNIWLNLREADRVSNTQNHTVRRDSASQFKGVNQIPTGRWRAHIRINGRMKHLGMFDTPEEAYEAYCGAAKVHHGIFFKP